jgi:hypothetical protein
VVGAGYFLHASKQVSRRQDLHFDDPVSYIFSNAQSVISEAVNNELQQSIYRVALEAESTAREKGGKQAVTVSNTWFQKVGEENGNKI